LGNGNYIKNQLLFNRDRAGGRFLDKRIDFTCKIAPKDMAMDCLPCLPLMKQTYNVKRERSLYLITKILKILTLDASFRHARIDGVITTLFKVID
jgi:hypothetical protein